ncbi:hypothetical protein BFG57_06900 [Bacillus solimangrovi]|uniref:DUF2785 domain-containing protein n=2 Tax=Bacillus solimangrovi TaxID=1305675 RepID=A0A1E5LAN7_9BACI|nr:hypothetical protein BFG57_06900 [Bacillus solimangrovi]
MKESNLKNLLDDIINRKANLSEENRSLIVQSMIEHIGSIDEETRELIYATFYRIIIEEKQLEPELLKELLEKYLNDLLFKGIGENGTETVFTRAFTSLLISLILHRDNEEKFLLASSVYKLKEKLIQYINMEKDLRGYVPERGWAHSIAHVADAIDELVKNHNMTQDSFREILYPLWNKIFASNSVYIHNEDERILTPIITMLDKGLEVQEIVTLVQKIPEVLERQKEQLDNQNYYFLLFNSKTFLKSFYMKVSNISELETLKKNIEQCLKEI